MNSPAFPFYFSDFHASTSQYPPEYVGGYLRLLGHQWCNGKIPSDIKALKTLVGRPVFYSEKQFNLLISNLLEKFPKGPRGVRRNRRLEEEREKQKERKRLQSLGGKRGMASRYGLQGSYNIPFPIPNKKVENPKLTYRERLGLVAQGGKKP